MFKSSHLPLEHTDKKSWASGGASSSSLMEYPTPLNFYEKPPMFDVKLEQFEQSALDRLRILAEIESCSARGRPWEETKRIVTTLCQKYLHLSSNTAGGDMGGMDTQKEDERRTDHLSHFVLRLAFCRTEDLRQRFITAESTLFRCRFEEATPAERTLLYESRDFKWVKVDDVEKKSLEVNLRATLTGFKNIAEQNDAWDRDAFYKVRWSQVPQLVEHRRVFLKKGWAYVPARQQSAIVFREFEVHLRQALNMTNRAMPQMDEDTRLTPIIDHLSQGFLAGVASDWQYEEGDDTTKLRAEQVDEYAKKHWPLCMRSIHDQLKKDHHVKHYGRLYYTLFLKGMKLDINEAIAFWKKSFQGGKVTEDKFNKEYRYNIRHTYGQEGKRANYQAKTCVALLTGNAEYGCPYRFLAPESLQTRLQISYADQGLQSSDIHEILNNKKGSHFNIACTRVFEITHAKYVKKGEGLGQSETVTHPNLYAERSIEFETKKEGSAKVTSKEEDDDLEGIVMQVD